MVATAQQLEWTTKAKEIFITIYSIPDSVIFHKPIDEKKLKIPDYHEIVRNPMDLSKIREKLNASMYSGPQEFIDDMYLVFNNCLMYNDADSKVSRVAENLKLIFTQRIRLFGLLCQVGE